MVIEWARAVSNLAILHSTASNAIMHDAREYQHTCTVNSANSTLFNFPAIVNTPTLGYETCVIMGSISSEPRIRADQV